MLKEIGSEFHLMDIPNNTIDYSIKDYISFGEDQLFLFSGRAAIDYVLNDLDVTIKTVYMPSYCCSSMIQAFKNKRIKIYYYDVQISTNGIKYEIDFNKNIDIFFAMSYFGFSITNMDREIKEFKKKNKIIIEDVTHRLFSRKNHCEFADYSIASIRKWIPTISGGLAIKHDKKFTNHILLPPPNKLINIRQNAMIKKREYLANELEDYKLKREFLDLFTEFNGNIGKNFERLSIDDYSMRYIENSDVCSMQEQRKKNVQCIYDKLQIGKKVNLLIKEFNEDFDCPLFVPLMGDTDSIKLLKRKFIEDNIYCPSHWPIPAEVILCEKTREIYDREISLICDQRYNEKEMFKIMKIINDFK